MRKPPTFVITFCNPNFGHEKGNLEKSQKPNGVTNERKLPSRELSIPFTAIRIEPAETSFTGATGVNATPLLAGNPIY